MSFESDLYNALDSAGIQFEGQINWNSRDIQRFREPHKKGKNVWLCLHPGGASFGNWRLDINQTWWEKPWKKLTKIEKSNRTESLRVYDQKQSAEKEKRFKRALLKANQIFDHPKCSVDTYDHPYVVKKRIIPYYARQIRSFLMLKIHNIQGELISIQYIYPDNRNKKFKKYLPIKGGFIYLGEKIEPEFDILWICEGWATGCAIYECVGKHVICALMASNLEQVAKDFRALFPKMKIVICADNDSHLSQNIGVLSAERAALATDSVLKIPPIPGDWNDVLNKHGICDTLQFLIKDII